MAYQFTSGTITFAGTNNTALETADNRFVKLPGATSTAVVYNGRLAASSTSSGPQYRYTGESPPSADYSVKCDLTMIGQNASYSSGPMLRAAVNGSNRDGYWFRHKHGTGWQIFRYLSGAATQIGATVPATYSTGRTYDMQATVVGDTVQLAVEDMVILTAVDASPLTAAGYLGVGPGSVTGSGEHLDNLEGWTTDGLVTYPESTQVLANAAWTWFNAPEAVSYNGYTYLGYITSAGDIGIAKINETTLSATTAVVHAALEVDDHDNPSVTIRADGRILLMYSKHNDAAGIRCIISTNAEDITAWGTETIISTGITTPCSYANTFKLSDSGKIYNFFRSGQGASGTVPWAFITSSDDGATWSGQTNILTETNATPYPRFWSNGVDRIDMLYVANHPELGLSSVYHAYAELDGSNNLVWYTTDGTSIGSSVSPASEGTLIFDATSIDAWVWDIHAGPDGHPWTLWVKFAGGGTNNHRLMFSRWTGSAWATPVDICKMGIAWATGDPNYSPGARFDAVDPTHIYVGRLTEAGAAPFEYITTDGGDTWSKLRQLAEGGTAKWLRPISPINRASKVAAIFATGTYTSYTSYSMAAKVFEAAASTTAVTSDATASYAIRAPVSSDSTASYALRAAVSSDSAPGYSVRAVVNSDTATSYAIRAPVSSDSTASYELLSAGAVSSDSTASYAIRAAVSGEGAVAYSVRAPVSADATAEYSLREAVAASAAASYDIITAVAASSSVSYTIDGPAGGACPTTAELTAAVMAALNATTIPVDVRKMNGASVIGDGTSGNSWRGVGVPP